jgi:hypothetical protein
MEEIARTDHTLSLRLYIRNDLFIQVFLGETSGSLYLALIERERRIFGVDREAGEWHIHPYDTPDQHQNLPEALEPKPLLKFIARVETLLLDHDLL